MYTSELQFEADFIYSLQQNGWTDGVLKNPTEKDLLDNWAKILFAAELLYKYVPSSSTTTRPSLKLSTTYSFAISTVPRRSYRLMETIKIIAHKQ